MGCSYIICTNKYIFCSTTSFPPFPPSFSVHIPHFPVPSLVLTWTPRGHVGLTSKRLHCTHLSPKVDRMAPSLGSAFGEDLLLGDLLPGGSTSGGLMAKNILAEGQPSAGHNSGPRSCQKLPLRPKDAPNFELAGKTCSDP